MKTDTLIDVYIQAVNRIVEKSLESPNPESIVQESLKAYLKSKDPYSDYLTPNEYNTFKDAQKSRYSGVGMELHQKKTGELICIPYPDSPAAVAGIRAGDRLMRINDTDIKNRSLYFAVSKIRGETGSSVLLTIKSMNQTVKKVKVVRKEIVVKTVVFKKKNKIPILKIVTFTPDTVRQLKYLITGLDEKTTMVLDLRQNTGGDLHASLDAAMLFLQKDLPLITVHSKKSVKEYKSLTQPVNDKSTIFIWQDEQTASAAEVFIAALKDNKRAESIGTMTFGKGSTQEIFEISDGSAVIITTGLFETPNQFFYNQKGISPSKPIKNNSPDTSHYIAKTEEIIHEKNLTTKNTTEIQQPSTPIKKPPEKPSKPKINRETQAKKPSMSKEIYKTESDNSVYICFKNNYNTAEEVNILSSKVTNTINVAKNIYSLERVSNNKTIYQLCIGPFGSKEEGEKRMNYISNELNESMYLNISARQVDDFDKNDSPSKNEANKSYWLQVGAFQSHDHALNYINKYVGNNYSFCIMITGNKNNISPDILKDIKDNNIRIQWDESSSKRYFRVMVGPYRQKEKEAEIKFKVTHSAIWRNF